MNKELELVDNTKVEGIKCLNVEASEVEDIMNYIIPQMKGIMNAKNGVGIAAPQVGINKKFSVYKIPETEDYKVIFNGMYTANGSRTQLVEGCLSYPNKQGIKTKRYKGITVNCEVWNDKDKILEKVTRRVKGVEAIIIQHEIDHWNGKTIYTK